MTTVTRTAGVVLIALGVLAYLVTGFAHPTALYRSVLGLVILVLGVLASREVLHRHMIHAALVVALLGLIGSIPAAAQLLTGAERPVASIVSLITALVCAGYLGIGIRSFAAARRATQAGWPAGNERPHTAIDNPRHPAQQESPREQPTRPPRGTHPPRGQ